MPEIFYLSDKYKKTIIRRAEENGRKIPDIMLKAINNNKISNDKTINAHPVYQNNSSGVYMVLENGVFGSLLARMGTGGNSVPLILEEKKDGNIQIRKITPLECCRLQGFPDNWTDDLQSESIIKRYKLWGNGIALPCVDYIIKNIKKEYENEHVGS